MKSNILMLLLIASILLFVGCKLDNEANESTEVFQRQIKELESEVAESLNRVELLEEDIKRLENEKSTLKSSADEINVLKNNIKTLEKENSDLKETIEHYEKNNDVLRTKLNEMEWEIYDYQFLNADYRQFIDANINEVILDDRCIKVNGIGIGSSYKDVLKALGEPTSEFTGMNESSEGGASSYMLWEYEGIKITFDPLYVYRIIITSEIYTVDNNIKVGDKAIEALSVLDKKYDKTISIHTQKEINGWYTTDYNNLIMLHYDDDNKINNQSLSEEDMRVEEIEIFNGIFP